MSNFSEGYYDLSITKKLSCAVLTTCEITTKTVIEYFFTTELGINSNLDPNEYGHSYILGLTQTPHKYDKEGTEKQMIVTMVGRSTSDTMSNDLPSNKNYGFKTNISFPIFSREIESYVLIPWESSKEKGTDSTTKQKPLYTPYKGTTTKTVLPAPHIRKKGSQNTELLREKKYDIKTRKVPKSKMSAGGGCKNPYSCSVSEAYASSFKPSKTPVGRLERYLLRGNCICVQVGNTQPNPVAEYVSKGNVIMLVPVRGLDIRPNSPHERLYEGAVQYGNKSMIKGLVNVSKLRVI